MMVLFNIIHQISALKDEKSWNASIILSESPMEQCVWNRAQIQQKVI